MAKQHKNFHGGLLQVQFFLPQLTSGRIAEFPAFITNLSDNFTSNWSAKQAYGFQDQVGVFQGTNRAVSLGLRIVASSVTEAASYQKKLNRIIMSLYPTYSSDGIPQSSPIVGLKVANVIHDNGNFLFGWLNGVSLTPNLSEGSFYNIGKQTLYDKAGKKTATAKSTAPMLPNLWDMSFEFNVIHNKRPGFTATANNAFTDTMFPVKVDTGKALFASDRPPHSSLGQPGDIIVGPNTNKG